MAKLSQPSYMKWLPPKTTATISRCELFGRTMKSGFISGRHRSPKKGNSVEFAEHRQYMPGDDLRTLDWKVLGRKDRLYIRQYEEETNLRTTILLDCSGSMAYDGDAAAEVDGKRLSKFDYARYLVAGLTYMLAGQQDAVGLVTFDTKIREYLPAKSSASQTRRILEFLDKSKPGGETDPAPAINDIAERIPSRGFVIVVSDLFTSDPDELVKALHHFNYRKHEIAVLHDLDPAAEPPFNLLFQLCQIACHVILLAFLHPRSSASKCREFSRKVPRNLPRPFLVVKHIQ